MNEWMNWVYNVGILQLLSFSIHFSSLISILPPPILINPFFGGRVLVLDSSVDVLR